ncbi:hypothetical protein ACJMK2_015102, partial [Sinanodonta woodiana]
TSYECYDATIETSCCASCNAIATYISGEYVHLPTSIFNTARHIPNQKDSLLMYLMYISFPKSML